MPLENTKWTRLVRDTVLFLLKGRYAANVYIVWCLNKYLKKPEGGRGSEDSLRSPCQPCRRPERCDFLGLLAHFVQWRSRHSDSLTRTKFGSFDRVVRSYRSKKNKVSFWNKLLSHRISHTLYRCYVHTRGHVNTFFSFYCVVHSREVIDSFSAAFSCRLFLGHCLT